MFHCFEIFLHWFVFWKKFTANTVLRIKKREKLTLSLQSLIICLVFSWLSGGSSCIHYGDWANGYMDKLCINVSYKPTLHTHISSPVMRFLKVFIVISWLQNMTYIDPICFCLPIKRQDTNLLSMWVMPKVCKEYQDNCWNVYFFNYFTNS